MAALGDDAARLRAELVDTPFFAGLSPAALDVLVACAGRQVAAEDEVLLREGDPADACWLVVSGRVAVELHAADRGSLVIGTVGAGEILGWSWLHPPYRWHFDGRAVTRCELVVFDARCLRRAFDAEPAIGLELVRRFLTVGSRRLHSARLQLLDLYGAGPDRATGPGSGDDRP